jgi:transmembrane sensor
MKAKDLDLLLRSLDIDLPPPEADRARHLLASSATARAELDRFGAVRSMVAEHGSAAFEPWFADRVLRRMASTAPAERAPAALPWRRLAGVSFAVAVTLAFVVMFFASPRTVRVPYGEMRSLQLPDGSQVELASGTSIRFARLTMGTERLVRLEGEAFFDVVSGPRPFVVETFNARVVVYGTRFNVRAWPDDLEAETVVALESGAVEVSPLASDAPVRLAPGEMTSVGPDTVLSRRLLPSAVERATAWRTGGIAFVDRPLRSAFDALERRYDVRIDLADGELARLRLTYLNPRPSSASDVLADMCHAHGLRYRRTANGFEVARE